MPTNHSEAVEQYRRAAQREHREGKPVAATLLSNIAWLTNHPEGWLDYNKEASDNVA